MSTQLSPFSNEELVPIPECSSFAQKNYFALHKSGADQTTVRQALQYSLRLENQVDREISRVQEILKRTNL